MPVLVVSEPMGLKASPRRGLKLANLALGLALGLGLALTLALESPVITAETARVTGDLAMVSPRANGRIARVLVEEGAPVKVGQALATLDPSDLTAAVATAEANLAAAETGLPASRTAAALQEASRQAAVAQAQEALAVAQAELGSAQTRAAQAAVIARTRQSGQQKGLVSLQELAAGRADAEAAASAASASRARLRASQAALAAAHAQAAQGSIERPAIARSAAEIRRARTDVALARLRLGQASVSAPVAGTLVRRLIGPGEYVAAGQAVFQLLVATPLWVRAEVREADLAGLQVGARAEVSVDALPGRVWQGHVARIADVAEAPLATAEPAGPARVVAVIALDTPGAGLKPGLTARVTIVRGAGAPL